MMGRSRRSLLLAAAGSACLSIPGTVRAQNPAILFDVFRGGDLIGMHRLDFRREGETLSVDIAIELVVEIAWVPVFRYVHRNREVWNGAQLISLDSRTHDDGTDHAVSARRAGETLVVEGDAGTRRLEGDLLPTSYWHPLTTKQHRLLDTQTGRVVEVSHTHHGREQVIVAGRPMEADRYVSDGDIDLTVLYNLDRAWCGLSFDARGEQVEYRVADHMDGEIWLSLVNLTQGGA